MRKVVLTVISIMLLSSLIGAQVPDTVWTKTFGGADTETAEVGAALSNNEYAFGGYTVSFGYPGDAYIVKFDANGDTLWTGLYGAGSYDYVRGIVESHDSQLVVAGKHSASVGAIRTAWLFKTDATGVLDWEHDYTGADDLETQTMIATADSGFILAGYTRATGNNDIWLLKTDVNGDSLWYKTFVAAGADLPTNIRQTPDGGYLIVGTTTSFGGGDIDVWVIRTDAVGDTLWTRVYGDTENEASPKLDETNDGGYIILSGATNPVSTTYDPWLIKIDLAGDTAWTKFATCDRSISTGAICQTSDDGFLVAGGASYGSPLGGQFYIVKLDSNADTVWSRTYGGNGSDRAMFVHEDADNKIMLLGQWYGATSYGDYYAVKLEGAVVSVDDESPSGLPDGFDLYQNYPNPFNPQTMITFSLPSRANVSIDVFNILGQQVVNLAEGSFGPGEHSVIWDGRDSYGHLTASGIYLYRLKTDGFSTSRKMLLVK